MPKIITQPSERSVFLVAAGGVTLAILALLFAPTPVASEAVATGSGSKPASQATSKPAKGAASAEAHSAVAAVATSGTGLQPADFPTAAYATLLSTYLDAKGFVNYEKLAGPGKPELQKLVDAIAQTDLEALNGLRDMEMAAWYANAYNILTLKTIVDHYPIKSIITDIEKPWDQPFTVAGRPLTLNQIEHEILRMKDEPKDRRVAFVNPGLHFAVNCASIGCPRLQPVPFTAANLLEMYAKGANDFAANPAQFQFDGKTWKISQLMDWYGDDFLLHHAEPSAPLAAKLKAKGVDQAEKLAAVAWYFSTVLKDEKLAYQLRAGEYSIEWIDYDWGLNKQS